MALDAVANFAKSALTQGYAAGVTSIDLVAGGGAKFPATPFNAVWWDATLYADPADDPTVEIVRVTNIAGDTLTVTRAQEGTADANHNTGGSTYKLQESLTEFIYNQLVSNPYAQPFLIAGDITSIPPGIGSGMLIVGPDAGDDGASIIVLGNSDGYTITEYSTYFVAAPGDERPIGGAATPGQAYTLIDLYAEYNDTTDATSWDWALVDPGFFYQIQGNAIQDIGIGNVNADYNPYPVDVSDANLFIKGDGTLVQLKGGLLAFGHSAIGANAAINDGSLLQPGSTFSNVLNLQESRADLTSTDYYEGLTIFLELDPAANATSGVYGIDNEIAIKAGNTRDLDFIQGFLNEVDHYGTGTISLLDVASNYFTNRSTGVISDLYCTDSEVNNRAGGQITNSRNLYLLSANAGSGSNWSDIQIDSLQNSGMLTNYIAVEIRNQTAATNNWAFKSGLGLVEHGDELLLNADIAHPLVMKKSTQSAAAPGAGFGNMRWLAGSNAGTLKLVANAGTLATEVTIVDNVGAGN